VSIKRALFVVVSVVLSVGLLSLVLHFANINLPATFKLAGNASPIAFAKLLFLNFLLVLISTERWRSIDAVIRNAESSVPSFIESLAVTSVGMALGLLLPVQVGLTTARSLGTYFHRQALKRGMAGTIFEQTFDALIVGLFGLTSVFTRVLHGSATLWAVLASMIIACALFSIGPSLRLMGQLAAQIDPDLPHSLPAKLFLKSVNGLRQEPVLQEPLVRRLALFSIVRFFIVVAMAGETAAAVGLPIPFWHFAAAVPFVFMASILAITPGGLGVNELTSATALRLFGTPLAIAGQWSLANRILGTCACLVVAGCAVAVHAIQKYARASKSSLAPGSSRI
jgi:uncharacterized membrane protein YbhN (UPF0104 family)